MSSQSGQIGVIILLIMVVLLTIGLSLAARTTQELFTTQQTADSARVFNAAEAGIEEGLATDFETATFQNDQLPCSISTIENTDVNCTVTRVYTLETRTFEGVDVLADLPDDGTTNTNGVTIDWSRESDCSTENPASLLVSVYNHDTATNTTTMRSYPLAGCDHSDGFASSTRINQDYTFRYNLPLQAKDIFVRIKPIYNDTHVKVSGNGWTLPVQYYHVRSEARNANGDEVRAVEVNRTLPMAPSILDFAVFSGDAIIK
jgi:Tfp pilus assembly protein PilX